MINTKIKGISHIYRHEENQEPQLCPDTLFKCSSQKKFSSNLFYSTINQFIFSNASEHNPFKRVNLEEKMQRFR